MKRYTMSGILNGWKIISEEIKAKSKKEAKSKLRRRYPKIQSIIITDVYKTIF